MSYQNVEISKKVNVYHDGKVTSRPRITADGMSKILDFMQSRL